MIEPAIEPIDEQPDNRWLGSYAALFTLLFALFVILYATSQADLSKLKQVSDGMKTAFSGEGSSTSSSDGTKSSGAPGELRDLKDNLEAEISAIVAAQVGVSPASDIFEFELDSNGVDVRVLAKNFFKPGESEVNPDLRPLLDRIAKIILEAHRSVRIEGHADEDDSRILAAAGTSPDRVSRFKNTWELSAARAAWVAQYWMKRFNFDPEKLEIAGFSRYRPLPPGGKYPSRRIQIAIH